MNTKNFAQLTLISFRILGLILSIHSNVHAESVVHGTHSEVLSPIDNIQMLQNVARVADDTTQSANRFFAQLGFANFIHVLVKQRTFGSAAALPLW